MADLLVYLVSNKVKGLYVLECFYFMLRFQRILI